MRSTVHDDTTFGTDCFSCGVKSSPHVGIRTQLDLDGPAALPVELQDEINLILFIIFVEKGGIFAASRHDQGFDYEPFPALADHRVGHEFLLRWQSEQRVQQSAIANIGSRIP